MFVKLLSLKQWELKSKFYFRFPTFYLWTWENHTDKKFIISLILRGLKILAVDNPDYLNNVCLYNLVRNYFLTRLGRFLNAKTFYFRWLLDKEMVKRSLILISTSLLWSNKNIKKEKARNHSAWNVVIAQ